MPNEHSPILTLRGRQKLAAALAGGAPLQLTQMAVGDAAAYSPTEADVALRNERYRAPINHLYQHSQNPAWVVASMYIPAEVGGFHIREIGVFDADGELIAISQYGGSYKPVLTSGAVSQTLIELILEVSNTAALTLLIDPSVVMATRSYVDGLVQDAVAGVTGRIDRQDAKNSARVATIAHVVLTGLQTIDGVALAIGDRVLVKNQNNAAENGIYAAAAGAWTRTPDANTSLKVTPGLFIAIEEGTQNGGAMWQLDTPATIALNATPLHFAMVSGRTGVAAGSYNEIEVDERGRAVGGSRVWVPKYLQTGAALPTQDIGPIWHDDYNDWMTWQVFSANGADYSGYASRLVGSLLLDTQPTVRKGYVASGAGALSRTTYAALRNWAIHTGIMVAAGAWVAGTIAVADNADGTTFRLYDVRGEFFRAWDGGRGIDTGRQIGTWQTHMFAKHAHPVGDQGRSLGNSAGSSYSASIANPPIVNTTAETGGTETRPRNVSLSAVVKF